MKVLICNAIKNKSCLEFNYDGSKRLVEPHAFGYSEKEEAILRAWEVSKGGKTSAKWKMYSVSDITNMTVSEAISQAPRKGYKRNDPKIHRIICQL